MITLQSLATKRRISGKRGFTLMEILIVLAIIAMLVALIGPNIFRQFSGAKKKATAVQMTSLITSLGTMKIDIGRYPTDEEGLNLLVSGEGVANWNGPYVTNGVLPKDSWTNDFLYAAPAEGADEPVLTSLGADGKEGGTGENGDITSAPTAG